MILILWLTDYEQFGIIKRSMYELMRQFKAPEMVGVVKVDKLKITLEYPNYTNIVHILNNTVDNVRWFTKEKEEHYFKLHKCIEFNNDFDKFKKALKHLEL